MEPGTQLGHYTIQSLIGKGGMGEVYQAKDEKLGRQVAIKVLPEEFTKDADRVARFQREARLLASLNHPSIAAIHGLEETDGKHFLVLELVEGDTLADRLKSGAIPVEQSLKLALQIAEALEAAHEKGVIHRDLKPANIKVTPEGKVKVLDFGLAKAFAGDQADVSVSNSPTISMAATQQGIILGTAAYMSPEQAKGRETDKRTDIFAFGAVLYEMLTAKPAFPGDDVSDILASVLKTDPDWDDLPVNLHHRLRELLERSLEKDLNTRYHDVADTRVDIQKVLADPSGVIVQPYAEAAPARLQSKLPWVAAVALAILSAGAVWLLKPEPLLLVSRSQHFLPEGRQLARVAPGRRLLTISPDGSQFVYSGAEGLYLRSFDELEAQFIPGTEGNLTSPTFSPDGEWLAFWSDGQLKKIAVVGGAAVTLTGIEDIPSDISWDVEGTILYATVTEGILSVSADGGEPELVLSPLEAAASQSTQLLADGSAVLFDSQGQIVVHSLDSGESALLFPGTRPRYVSTGHIVYGLEDALYAVPFDLGSLEVTGGPVPMVEDARNQYALSDSGSLVYLPALGGAVTAVDGVLTWVDRNGAREPLPVPSRPYRHPRLSPDGTRLAVSTTEANGQSAIWIYDLDGATQMRQLTGPGNNMRPIWSPDGEWLTFVSDRDGGLRIYRQPADLSGVAQFLLEERPGGGNADVLFPESWTPDGNTLSFTSGGQVFTASIKDGVMPEFLSRQGSSAFSPDGEWIVFRDAREDGQQLYLQPFPPTGTEYRLTQEGASGPMWSPDGSELFYRGDAALQLGNTNPTLGGQFSTLVTVEISLSGVPEWSIERPLPIEGFMSFPWHRDYDITPDGERFIMIFPEGEVEGPVAAARPQINIVLNWIEELKERVPVDSLGKVLTSHASSTGRCNTGVDNCLANNPPT